jgi:predicted RNA methylase
VTFQHTLFSEGIHDYCFYETPRWLIDLVLREAPLHGSILDAGAGKGALSEAVQAAHPDTSITAVEIHPERCAHMRGEHPGWTVVESDFLGYARDLGGKQLFDGIIMNPPFKIKGDPKWPTTWDSFVLAGLSILKPGATMLVVGFANVLGGMSRVENLHRRHPPQAVYWSMRRPRYREDKLSGASRDTIILEYSTNPSCARTHPRVVWI